MPRLISQKLCRRCPKTRGQIFATFAAFVAVAAANPDAHAAVAHAKFQEADRYLLVETLTDDVVHFELSAILPGPSASDAIYTTPMVQKSDYQGPTSYEQQGHTILTANLRVEVSRPSLCVSVYRRSDNFRFTQFCPQSLDQAAKGLSMAKDGTTQVYGLGEQFTEAGNANGQWVGRKRTAGGEFGNAMVGYEGGAVGNAQFPIMYALGSGFNNYAVFLDQVYRQDWDFQGNPFVVSTWGDQLRWYFIHGKNLPQLRTQYMDLVGHPLVPPKKSFGLWVSEYGFDNWQEVDDKLATLRRNKFPIDGFVFDLQWFGGVYGGSDNSPMGHLAWDTVNFPNPGQKLKDMREKEGLGAIVIEESYVSRGLPEHQDLEGRNYLARDCEDCGATYITYNPWWGKGGMIDWTNPAAGDYWHDLKRQALIDEGVYGHWTDLGEPEMYNGNAWYYGFPALGKYRQADIHNIYNLKWAESIARGYARHHVTRRPVILSRSGAPGIQRYGAAMWSADIGSNLDSLAAHENVQMHMSLSGIDYFGADIGGFHRSALRGDLDEMFTQWFANGATFDVPVRVHTENLCNCKETAPDRVGNLKSNLENIRWRYRVSPYLYSLAHEAYAHGTAVFPPLLYQYQDDATLRDLGHEKLLGRDILAAIVAHHGESQRDVYLPRGEWYRWSDNGLIRSAGQWVGQQAEYVKGIFSLPKFARAGALIPLMFVDDKTMNILGKRSDGSVHNELIVKAFRGEGHNDFTLYEDDGESVAYQHGQVRTTRLEQDSDATSTTITIRASQGSYDGAVSMRENHVVLVSPMGRPTRVTVNGVDAVVETDASVQTRGPLRGAGAVWFMQGKEVVVKTAVTDVTQDKVIMVAW